MIYSNPTFPNSSKEESRSRIFNPYFPINMPASTIPMICGMRSLPMMMGANRMMSNTTQKINVGLVIGKYDAIYNILCAKVRISE
jgi:hypothetical protein